MPLYIYSRPCLSRSDAATNQESCVEVEPTIHLWIRFGEYRMTPHRPRKCPQTRFINKHNRGDAVRFELPSTPLSESTRRPRDATTRKYLLNSSCAHSWPKAIDSRGCLRWSSRTSRTTRSRNFIDGMSHFIIKHRYAHV
ncbi:hypothetical protein QQF64_028149 [Cirrhinus molitorella]|uniref:Uncharacterized protein n=1 Tax=Cirrhinus molitorella TaxID=172907 RepID=A0ABR3N652_9TELE